MTSSPNPSSPAATSAKLPYSQRYPWVVVAMLWFICFFNYADRQAIFSIFPLLESELGFNKAQLGFIGAAFTWVYALSAPFAGQVGDRYPRKTVILAGLYVWSIITGFTALCSKVWHFAFVRAAEGLGETFYFPASMSLISDYHTRDTRSRAMSFHQTSVYAGTIGGGALAGWMGMHFGWQSPFILLGVAGVVLGLVLAKFIREPGRNEAEIAAGNVPEANPDAQPLDIAAFLRMLAATPTALALIVAFFGANFVGLVFLSWMPTFLKEKFELNLAVAGIGATVFIQVASMFGAMSGGWLADRWRKLRPGGRILVQAVGTLGGAPFIYFCGETQKLALLIPAMTAFGFFKGLYDANIWASLYDVVPAARRGTAVGIMNMIGWLGGGLGSISVGLAVTQGFGMSETIASTAAIYIVVAIVLTVAGLVFAPRDVQRASAT
ncbi:MAG: MFS transporter [Pirellulales bacterium]|nr:MFS transporter [Pirellulales bacterium]